MILHPANENNQIRPIVLRKETHDREAPAQGWLGQGFMVKI